MLNTPTQLLDEIKVVVLTLNLTYSLDIQTATVQSDVINGTIESISVQANASFLDGGTLSILAEIDDGTNSGGQQVVETILTMVPASSTSNYYQPIAYAMNKSGVSGTPWTAKRRVVNAPIIAEIVDYLIDETTGNIRVEIRYR